MLSTKPIFPSIPENERTPLIDLLLEIIQWQQQQIDHLEDEIQDLKKETKKPTFESSKMDEKTEDSEDEKEKKPTIASMSQVRYLMVFEVIRGARFIAILHFPLSY